MGHELNLRIATVSDAFDIMRVYQLDRQTSVDDALFTHLPSVAAALSSDGSLWLAIEQDGRLEGFAWLLIDREQRLSKINGAYVNPSLPAGREAAIERTLAFILDYLRDQVRDIDILYTSLRPLAYSHDLVRALGFKILGIFPNGKEIDNSLVNSLAAYFFNDVLERQRQTGIQLHPNLERLFEITAAECGLPALPIADERPETPSFEAEFPDLEIITAPKFVAQRFSRLKSRQFLSIQFYPFHQPNTLITDPAQSVEIFVTVFPGSGMAAVIGERIDLNIDPVGLYKKVADLLRSKGVYYIEVINDAGDAFGTDAIINAGYLPCAYFPALKCQGESRRDYVVFARSFENFRYPALDNIGKVYVDYLKQFYRLEAKTYHHYFDEN